MTTRSTIAAATNLLFDPSVDLKDTIDRHFGPSFRRRANDGAWGGRAELAERMTQLREVMASGSIEVHEELIDGPRYADRHTIEIHMSDGTLVRTEVYLFARHDTDGRFSEIQEATVTLPDDANVDSASL
jgi:hypothetical protein